MSSLKKEGNASAPKPYWRSLAEWAEDPAVAESIQREFPTSPLDTPNDDGFARRRFLQLMGASMALASGAACRWEKEKIIAFTRRPAGHVSGVPKHFATMMELQGVAQPLTATSYDGRPIKVDGNEKHPASRGASGVFAQASILELYDPDRSQALQEKNPSRIGEPTWDDFVAWLAPLRKKAAENHGQGFAILAEASTSPTLLRLLDRMRTSMPQMRVVHFEPLHYDNERFGTKEAFGAELRPVYALREARVVVSLDADLFSEHPNALVHSADFSAARRPENEWMTRLWAVESRHSATGGAADHRLPLRSQQMKPFLLALMAEIVRGGEVDGATDLQALKSMASDGFLTEPAVKTFITNLAQDLRQQHGKSAIVIGDGQSSEVHQLGHQLNALLGNVGHSVRYVNHPSAGAPPAREALAQLCDDMRAGKIESLCLLGGNPGFDAPADVRFDEALARVQNSVHLSLYANETSENVTWHLPRTHYLEAWGDARSYAGEVTLAQPLIEPLYKTRTATELLSLWLGEEKSDGALLRETHAHGKTGDKELAAFRDMVQKGHVEQSGWPSVVPTRRPLRVSALKQGDFASDVDNGQLELTFWQDSHVYDGRFANNGWLQELPDFMSKLTWDNAAFVSPATAKALDIKHETMVTLEQGGRQITIPAYIMPGHAKGSIAVTLGYGRTRAGHVAGLQHGEVESAGVNTFALRGSDLSHAVSGLKVTATGKRFQLAITQDHHSLDALAKKGTEERLPQIVREDTLEGYRANPEFAKERVEHPPLKSLWKEFEYNGHRWGMAIDLNSCTGCNACVIACQAENNVPIVGKADVIRGREMHWLRLDRYFAGEPDAPQMVSQPMTCQQCEMAPCESVCPVGATMHSSEGLNDMVYNRCIGTRYCSNNCPYKVRRFNFFNYHKTLEHDSKNQVTKMAYNPEVTVRARGVMEKCTYCVQRIQNAKIHARNERRAIVDGEITPACAQACSADAIVFGDLSDPKSRVALAHNNPRAYGVLEELNTKPRTQYLARVRNPYGEKRRPKANKGEAHEEAGERQHG